MFTNINFILVKYALKNVESIRDYKAKTTKSKGKRDEDNTFE